MYKINFWKALAQTVFKAHIISVVQEKEFFSKISTNVVILLCIIKFSANVRQVAGIVLNIYFVFPCAIAVPSVIYYHY